MAAAASQAAVSRRTPVGAPASSRSTTGASAIGRRASAAEDSQAVWWSWAHSSTGRSPQAASSAARCGAGSPAGQRSPRQPAPISQPSAFAGAAAARGEHVGVRARLREIEACERERPLEEMDVGVREARDDAAAAEIDALVGDERAVALAHVDAAADAVARDRERAYERQPGVAGAHAAVVRGSRGGG